MQAVNVSSTAVTTISVKAGIPFLHFYNNGAADIYAVYDGDKTNIDQSSAANFATTVKAFGIPIAPGEKMVLDNDAVGQVFRSDVWLCSASGTNEIRIAGTE